MSSNCNNSTAPINISAASVKADCSSKCNYIHDYPKSKCLVHNKGGYLSIEHSSTQTSPVKYNSDEMDVVDIRIYTPSIHTYSGKREAGEIIINHRGVNSNSNMLVCIPIKKSEESSTSTQLLQSIIEFSASSAPNDGESVNINLSNFTLSEFIPKSAFYSYEGNLLYSPCTGNNTYIVFHPSNGYVAMSEKNISKLNTLITKHTYNTKTGPLLFFNKTGTGVTQSKGGIYIDCVPVGEQGKILYNLNKNVNETSSSSSSGSNFDAKTFFSNPIVILIISFIGLVGVYKITKSGWDKFKEVKE